MTVSARLIRSCVGFTLVEAVLSVAVVGVLLVSSTAVFGTIARNRTSQTESRMAMLLAQQLMAEILQSKFQQDGTTPPFGPQGGQTRLTFTAVDSYHGYTATPPVSTAGTTLSEYAGWTQAVSVAFADVTNPATVVATSTLKKVTVTITAPSKKPYTLVGWRSKFGAYEFAPNARTTYVTGVAVSVQGVSPAITAHTGAHPLNVTTSQ